IEHAILHLLYARFWTKVMRDLNLIKVDEPFTRLLTQGMVLNHIYSHKNDRGGIEYFWPTEVEDLHDGSGKVSQARRKTDGLLVNYEGVGTMSKSKNNGVDPQDLIEKYGADTARLYTMFTAPPEATLEWNDAGVEGSYRFLRRVWDLAVREKHAFPIAHNTAETVLHALRDPNLKAIRREMHLHLQQANYDYERMQYNTVVSACMKMMKTLDGMPSGAYDLVPGVICTDEDTLDVRCKVLAEAYSILIRVLYPACPHIAHTLWIDLGFNAKYGDLLDAPWPEVDSGALQQDEIELVLQINGKLRGAVTVPAGADRAAIEAAALATEAFIKQSGGAPAKKVIVVPGRLVNIVV
uniref:class I tRNA ligase family protein n=1 Tax=Polaromonas sp. TaxID=1869339 RepID=UPI00286C85A3